MVMLAHFQESGGDRRGSARRALRLDVESNRAFRGSAKVAIHDLSLTGVLIETSMTLAVGEMFEVDLPEAGAVAASVIWSSGEYYGCKFKRPISTVELSAALLRSMPREPTLGSHSRTSDLVAELRNINEQVERIAGRVERAADRLASQSRDNS